jgi:excisionase family DNA binding protein
VVAVGPEAQTLEQAMLALAEAFAEEVTERVAKRLAAQTPETAEASPWLDLEGACAYLGFSRNALYKLTAAKAIPCRKKQGGQGLRFHRDEVDEWMRDQYPRVDRLD